VVEWIFSLHLVFLTTTTKKSATLRLSALCLLKRVKLCPPHLGILYLCKTTATTTAMPSMDAHSRGENWSKQNEIVTTMCMHKIDQIHKYYSSLRVPHTKELEDMERFPSPIFSYLSTNVAKTMTKNGWPESLTKSMTKYVKVASSSDRMKDYDSKVILKALAITHAELVEWIQIHKNRKLLANIIVSILDEYQNAREIAPTVLHLDTTYAVLQNPNTNWNNAKIIDRIRPIYLVHASLLAGGDYDLIWWFQH